MIRKLADQIVKRFRLSPEPTTRDFARFASLPYTDAWNILAEADNRKEPDLAEVIKALEAGNHAETTKD